MNIHQFKRSAKFLLWLEPLVLLTMVYTFWFPSNYPAPYGEPIDRAQFAWLVLFVPIFMLLRFIAYGRLWSRTPLEFWLIGLIVVGWLNLQTAEGILNRQIAPYPTRGIFMLMRPLLGLALVVYLMETARAQKSMLIPLLWMLALGFAAGIIALGTTQWVTKAAAINAITDSMPRFTLRPFIDSFNPNELAGALAWLTPLLAGLMLYPWSRGKRILRGLSAAAFILLFAALFLGQSRFAITGVILGLGGIALFIVPRGLPRYTAVAGVVVIILLQAALFLNIFPPPSNQTAPATTGISARDESSFNRRFDIWRSALDIVIDHPLTGAGINTFRTGDVRRDYPVVTYDFDCPQTTGCPRVLPHAHNELLQLGADLGIPGLIIFIGWHVATAYMLWRCWRSGDQGARVVAVSVATGLLAHIVFSMGDAITLWDRFYFVHWLLIGLAAGQYVLMRLNYSDTES
ncbi:MAG: O-antigen ligase family protein [Chitinophagaceae bacterium]|nr:O-antigen ligase family protein [Anaerolineae bacterium]